jgi:antibiotic biosynthesis monooxygenase (ABM) superfamily enzyme
VTRPNPGPSLSSARTAPSIHVRAALTWLAIFPLVAIGITAMAPFSVGWDPVLRAFVLTLVVVPLAVYVVVPWLMSIYDRYLAPRRQVSEKVCSRSGPTTGPGRQ